MEQVLFTIACITVFWMWFFELTLAGRVVKNLDSTDGLINIFNKCSALFIWSTAMYLFIGLI